MSYYGDLEDGIAFRIRSLKYVPPVVGPPPVPASGYLKKIVAYGGASIIQEREQLIAGAPMVAIQAQPSAPRRKDLGGTFYRETKVAVHVADRSLRGQAVQRRGSGHTGESPGIYEIVEDIYDLLLNQQPCNSAGVTVPGTQWTVVDESILANEKDLQVWVLMFATVCAHNWPQVDRTTLRDFTSAEGTGNLIDPVHDGLEHLLNTWP
jgi:hypothetical protein